MQTPAINVQLSKPLACTDDSVTIDVLVQIVPPHPNVQVERPPLNLGLVLDRSSSMAGDSKLPYAIKAAVYAVEQLLPTDRVSVTLYDDKIETPVPSTLATNKKAIVQALEKARPRGSTDLYGGWLNGMTEVRKFLMKSGVNRVLLLSDGQANQGVTDPNEIARGVADVVGQGISTSTIGVGTDYNEHLMLQMAQAGGGNYFFVNDPEGFQAIFQTELHGLMNMVGKNVSLGISGTAGVTVIDQLNDYGKLPTGNFKLPEMVAGMPIVSVFRLKVAARSQAGILCSIRLAWDNPASGTRESRTTQVPTHSPVPFAEWNRLPNNPEVTQQAGLLFNARAQREFSEAVEAGNHEKAKKLLSQNLEFLACLPPSPEISNEIAYDMQTMAIFESDALHAKKRGHYRSAARQQALLEKMKDLPGQEPPNSNS